MQGEQKTLISRVLTVIGILLLVTIYHLPIWWVSLTAPNYPAEAFPDGVRIHFHANGVVNGCQKIVKEEITEDVALDCVHEMDTINHYVGMYPIAAGGVLERAFSPFLFGLLAVMLVGFMITSPNIRSLVLAFGFASVAAWMYLAWFAEGGLEYQNAGYIESMVTALDQDTSRDNVPDSGNAIVDRLRQSLKSSGVKVEENDKAQASDKTQNIDLLRVTFEKNQERKNPAERMTWNGSGSQLMAWHYQKSLARYFNVAEEIKPMVATMSTAGTIVFWFIIAVMLLMPFITRRTGSLPYWLLVVPAILLPLIFIIDYSAWLWWYGHSLNDMGAFTVKPFMPTVFGDGKVAQFTTHSYPSYGFGLMVLSSLVLVIAANQRYRQLKQLKT